jgi:cell division protein FtsW (lipid II flippase)
LIVFGAELFSQNIQIHDTYFEPFTLFIWLTTPIILLVFSLRAVGQKFKNNETIYILIVSLLLLVYLLTKMFWFYSDFKNDILSSDNKGINHDDSIKMINTRLAWIIAGIIISIGLAGFLSYRTTKNSNHSTQDK